MLGVMFAVLWKRGCRSTRFTYVLCAVRNWLCISSLLPGRSLLARCASSRPMAYSWIGISPVSISNAFYFSFLEAQTKYLRPYRDNIDEQRSNATRAQLDRRILLREATFFAVSAESTRLWIH